MASRDTETANTEFSSENTVAEEKEKIKIKISLSTEAKNSLYFLGASEYCFGYVIYFQK